MHSHCRRNSGRVQLFPGRRTHFQGQTLRRAPFRGNRSSGAKSWESRRRHPVRRWRRRLTQVGSRRSSKRTNAACQPAGSMEFPLERSAAHPGRSREREADSCAEACRERPSWPFTGRNVAAATDGAAGKIRDAVVAPQSRRRLHPLPPAPLRPMHPLPSPQNVLIPKQLAGEPQPHGGCFAVLLADMHLVVDGAEDGQARPHSNAGVGRMVRLDMLRPACPKGHEGA